MWSEKDIDLCSSKVKPILRAERTVSSEPELILDSFILKFTQHLDIEHTIRL